MPKRLSDEYDIDDDPADFDDSDLVAALADDLLADVLTADLDLSFLRRVQ